MVVFQKIRQWTFGKLHKIPSDIPAKSLELKHTISRIQELDALIKEADNEIQIAFNELNSTITSIPGISYTLGSMILAEIGDINRFETPDKILAYAGLSPSTYQSGKLESTHAKMEKRGSR